MTKFTFCLLCAQSHQLHSNLILLFPNSFVYLILCCSIIFFKVGSLISPTKLYANRSRSTMGPFFYLFPSCQANVLSFSNHINFCSEKEAPHKIHGNQGQSREATVPWILHSFSYLCDLEQFNLTLCNLASSSVGRRIMIVFRIRHDVHKRPGTKLSE